MKFSQPLIQNLQLIAGHVNKGDTHSHAVLRIDNSAVASEGALVAQDADLDCRARRQCIQQVDVSTLAADFRDSSRHAHTAGRFDNLGCGDEAVTRHGAAFTV